MRGAPRRFATNTSRRLVLVYRNGPDRAVDYDLINMYREAPSHEAARYVEVGSVAAKSGAPSRRRMEDLYAFSWSHDQEPNRTASTIPKESRRPLCATARCDQSGAMGRPGHTGGDGYPMSGDTQSRLCWWLMLAINLAHSISGDASAGHSGAGGGQPVPVGAAPSPRTHGDRTGRAASRVRCPQQCWRRQYPRPRRRPAPASQAGSTGSRSPAWTPNASAVQRGWPR